jgi:hypothetical protein
MYFHGGLTPGVGVETPAIKWSYRHSL